MTSGQSHLEFLLERMDTGLLRRIGSDCAFLLFHFCSALSFRYGCSVANSVYAIALS